MHAVITGVAIVCVGFGLLSFASLVQRAALRTAGPPRNRLAAWSCELAASSASLRAIRHSGVLCIVAGGALLLRLAVG